jgi:hypothetical protein
MLHAAARSPGMPRPSNPIRPANVRPGESTTAVATAEDEVPEVEMDKRRSFDSKEMASRGRIGAAVTASRYDGRALTERARATFLRSFEITVDPDGTLPTEERARRARAAHRAHMLRLARASVIARRRRAA